MKSIATSDEITNQAAWIYADLRKAQHQYVLTKTEEDFQKYLKWVERWDVARTFVTILIDVDILGNSDDWDKQYTKLIDSVEDLGEYKYKTYYKPE